MQNWNEPDAPDMRKKWDNWVYDQKSHAIPVVNYASALVFACATIVEMAAQLA